MTAGPVTAVVRGLAPVGLLLWTLLAPTDARAAPRYGVHGGTGLTLGPVDGPGVAGSLSAVLSGLEAEDAPVGVIKVRGEVLGLWSPGGSAALPLLLADAGLGLSRLDLFVTAGVELFGVAWRDGYTFFATFGLVGGGGLALQVHPKVAIELRGLVCWLPDFSAAAMSEPDPAPGRPTLLFVSGLLGVVIAQ